MPEAIKNHAVKITIGTIIMCLLFVANTTWKVATTKAIGDAKDAAQDVQIMNLESDTSAISEVLKLTRESLARIEGALGITKDR